MYIQNRIEDALYLWENGRREGALVIALIAVAATSRRLFPTENIGDKQAFEQFLNQGVFSRISVEYRGALHPMYHVFYKWFRCELLHEGTLPVDIEFEPDEVPGMLSVRAGGAPDYVLKVSHNWFHELIHVVVTAPINSDQFTAFNQNKPALG